MRRILHIATIIFVVIPSICAAIFTGGFVLGIMIGTIFTTLEKLLK